MATASPAARTTPWVFVALIGILTLAAFLFLTGITWGLPSRAADRYLFGGKPAWSGKRIADLTRADRRWNPRRGADVDIDPLAGRSGPIPLNDTDEKRAAILLRYRLYTSQPDEMITMMALASMKPGERDFDPRLYQYGGLFIYPIGALLRLCSLVGLVHVTADLSYYLDRPEEFAKFYIVARCYVVASGLAGAIAVFGITRRIVAGLAAPPGPDARPRVLPLPAMAGLSAALFYILMPVVINMAHEAKPHLPGAVLMLYAVLAAMRYVDRPTWRRAAVAGILCGSSFGMVLSSWPVFVVLPLMTLLDRHGWSRRAATAALACGIGGVTYLATNPYILINLFRNRDVLRSNFGNSLAMYEIHRLLDGWLNVFVLMVEGTSLLPAASGLFGVGAMIVWAAPGRRGASGPADESGGAAGSALWLLLVPAGLIVAQFVAIGAGKPGEYGRFAIFPDVTLAIAAAVLVWRRERYRTSVRLALSALLALGTATRGDHYLSQFQADAQGRGSRAQCAARLAEIRGRLGPLSVALYAEPAPYCMPPLDVIENRLYLLPAGGAAPDPWDDEPNLVITTDETERDVFHWRPHRVVLTEGGTFPRIGSRRALISWANKTFEFEVLRPRAGQEAATRHAR